MFTKILLASDGSDHSNRAIDEALKMVDPYKDQVHIEVVYAVDGDQSKKDVLQYGDSDTASLKRKERFQSTIEYIEDKGLGADITILHGQPAETLIEYANEGDYDCVLVGSRGRNKFQTLILGSVSHKLVKYVNHPVIVVK
ncbi:universal stress protein [Salimicrobium halophilum]|uniref:Nucleotide-binding universal stress protein, UspA family n=1 Tax=Salimicrobium halophilum TaxID=86666 RepID=A0A1G8RJ66_9BACI|nr:universal stress protein [Salimicrobium halophilum]SDJ16913.1 Nucleotide-binding universal stress protein, UspA family [Salimicrobium halophilum]